MNTVEKETKSKKNPTTIGCLIERLQEFPENITVESFNVTYIDGRGVKCTINN